MELETNEELAGRHTGSLHCYAACASSVRVFSSAAVSDFSRCGCSLFRELIDWLLYAGEHRLGLCQLRREPSRLRPSVGLGCHQVS
jgi:hypothetical protein